VKIGQPLFAQLSLLPNPQILCFTMLFNLPDTPKTTGDVDASCEGIYIPM